MAKKTARKKALSVKMKGPVPKLTLEMPLDASKIKAIQRCLNKGHLRITINKVDLTTGKIGDGWLYD